MAAILESAEAPCYRHQASASSAMIISVAAVACILQFVNALKGPTFTRPGVPMPVVMAEQALNTTAYQSLFCPERFP